MNNEALIKFWKIINYENIKANNVGEDPADAYEHAMETSYEPINERFCIVKADGIYYLLEASGTKICNVIEAGDLGDSNV
jgi:hypothetical protein